ncbi:hypothetical protein ANN_26262 [Periplaneta americana]|uniref:Tc1-like transposase DDE domain-containing protein n=1 Tax=Periplaneta americana TaxID=6978 RepID=A0ABQ8S5V3_PERAM|nr:hypothetical protein ANN_26262 [Periplaneta americana]
MTRVYRAAHPAPILGIKVWGAIAYNGCTALVFVEGTLSSARYIKNIIPPILLPFLQCQGDVLFHQDSACGHTSRITQRAL